MNINRVFGGRMRGRVTVMTVLEERRNDWYIFFSDSQLQPLPQLRRNMQPGV